MIALDERNSRMKDFYDIYDILLNQNIESSVLQEAFRLTFQRRQTNLPASPAIFHESFIVDLRNLQLWTAFLTRIKAEEIPFSKVLNTIRTHLESIYQEMKG